jgi:hypothetical protein
LFTRQRGGYSRVTDKFKPGKSGDVEEGAQLATAGELRTEQTASLCCLFSIDCEAGGDPFGFWGTAVEEGLDTFFGD